MSFPRYPAYKDSGVPWMTEVPTHWEVIPAKKGIDVLTDFTANGSFASLAENVEYKSEGFARLIRMTDLRTGLQSEGIWIDEQAYNYLSKSALKGGELLMASVGSVGLVYLMPSVSYKASLAPNMYLIKPNDRLLSKFLYWSLLSQSGQDQLVQAATTTAQPKLNKDNVKSLWLSLPEQSEQEAIVDFLDRETAKIDALVAEQEQLITLLKEKRQAVISHAVTKGLDPSVPMKDSGVEWLGEVPAHWAIAALNYRYEVLLGKMLDEKKISGNHLAPYLRNVDVQWDLINVDDLPQMDFDGSDVDRYGLRAGDLLVCEGGDVGRSAIWQGQLTECYYQKALHRLRPRDELSDLPRFQFYLMQAAAKLDVFTGGQSKATIFHLTAEALRRYRFAYPRRAEQEQIVAHLDRAVGEFDELINEATSATQLLQERRSALISAAVTGQIDVRGLEVA